MRIGPLKITEIEQLTGIAGRTMGGDDSYAYIRRWRIDEPDGAQLVVGRYFWRNDEQDIRLIETDPPLPDEFHSLHEPMRVRGHERGNLMTLDLAVLAGTPDDRRMELRTEVSFKDVALRSGLDLKQELPGLGGVCGTRREVLGETGPNKDRLCVLFSMENQHVALVVLAACRLLPILQPAGGA